MEIHVKRKIAYGNERFYAENDNAKFLIELIGRPSLTRRQLSLCKKKGWLIKLIEDVEENENDSIFDY